MILIIKIYIWKLTDCLKDIKEMATSNFTVNRVLTLLPINLLLTEFFFKPEYFIILFLLCTPNLCILEVGVLFLAFCLQRGGAVMGSPVLEWGLHLTSLHCHHLTNQTQTSHPQYPFHSLFLVLPLEWTPQYNLASDKEVTALASSPLKSYASWWVWFSWLKN